MKINISLIALLFSVSGMAQTEQLASVLPADLITIDEHLGSIKLLEHPVFLHGWDNHECHVDSIDLSLATDTILLPLIDEYHGGFSLPVKGTASSRFGWRRYRYHYGTDIRLKTGDTIYAVFDGKVRYGRYNYGGYGNLVVIRHYNGLETYYAHLSKLLVDTNEYVRAGDPIGLGGSTGRSTGPHLHFEMRYLGNPIDPEVIIDIEGNQLRTSEFHIDKSVFAYKEEIRARRYHSVRSGETLSALARKYHTTVGSICRLNGIRSTSIIRIGQRLRVR